MRYVYPAWAANHWSPTNCTVERLGDSSKPNETHVVLDHSLQTTIAIGTEAECRSVVGTNNRNDLMEIEQED